MLQVASLFECECCDVSVFVFDCFWCNFLRFLKKRRGSQGSEWAEERRDLHFEYPM